MDTLLLQTKLNIPRVRPTLVPRPHLMDRLDEGIYRKLTLISAPAGFGKTTLASTWMGKLRLHGAQQDQAKYRTAWLSLDPGDNDPTRFLSYLIAALQSLGPTALGPVDGSDVAGTEVDVGKGALSLLRSPQPPPVEAVLTSLINDIAAFPDRFAFVLDDYHLIEAPAIHHALTYLLEHLPPQMHLVIATRDDPHLPLARLRASGQLTELRAAELRFTSSEAAELLNRVMGLDLSVDDVAALERRTEGWIAGLQLAAISMQGRKDASNFIRSFTGSHRFVLDYLVGEVLEQQPPYVQDFLLRTAPLDRLTGSLCDAVRFGSGKTQSATVGSAVRADAVESPTSQTILHELERANLFVVPLDEERRWYRYHNLFSDFLRHMLRQSRPGWLRAVHLRACEWYERHGFADEAIEHAVQAKDLERLATLIEVHFDTLYRRGEHAKLRRWLDGLPAELVFARPRLSIFRAWDQFSSGRLDAAERTLEAAERVPRETDLSPGSEGTRVRGTAAAIRAFLAYYRGDAPGTIHYARQALDNLPAEDLTWRSTAAIALGDGYTLKGEMAAAHRARLDALTTSRSTGDPYLSVIANLKVAVTLRQQGRLQRAIEICQQQYQLAEEKGLSETVVVGWLLAIWGEVLAELNDLDQAVQRAARGVALTERGTDVAMLGWSNACLMRVLFSRGDMSGAQEIIRKMDNLAQTQGMPPWVTNRMAAWQARIWLAQGMTDSASTWAQERGLDVDSGPILLHELQYRVLARILVAQGRLDEAARLLRRLLQAAESGGQTSRLIEILVIQALACQAGGDTGEALGSLEQALGLAKPGGFVRIFVDEGRPIAHLIYQAATLGILPDYSGRLLASFPAAEAEKPSTLRGPAAGSEMIEPLSERELEVLQLIAAGLTNQDIASRLFLSLNTVKAHNRNIYGKLNVHSRTRAVARARELGLLSPSPG